MSEDLDRCATRLLSSYRAGNDGRCLSNNVRPNPPSILGNESLSLKEDQNETGGSPLIFPIRHIVCLARNGASCAKRPGAPGDILISVGTRTHTFEDESGSYRGTGQNEHCNHDVSKTPVIAMKRMGRDRVEEKDTGNEFQSSERQAL